MPVEPKYHTAEHIVTAVFDELYDGILTDTRFKGIKVRLDYSVKLDEPIEEIAQKVESRANEIVKRNLDISYETITREEAEARMILRKVPADMDPIRLVHIGDYNATPCSGEHVKNTSEIGVIEIRTYNITEDGSLRITFMLRE
ncbi:MAG: hypothetical protein JW737_06930 [Acidobacteria bacterium]|nr:hypothetical protein [Acidobacteriota bacterium]